MTINSDSKPQKPQIQSVNWHTGMTSQRKLSPQLHAHGIAETKLGVFRPLVTTVARLALLQMVHGSVSAAIIGPFLVSKRHNYVAAQI